MSGNEQIAYRFRLARGFLDEARQDVSLQRWRSAVDNSQLSVENAVKAVLALLGPTGRTHNPAALLRRALNEGTFGEKHDLAEQLAEQAELLGPDIHVQSDYGDEPAGLTPWELFGEAEARQALAIAEQAVELAQDLFHPKETR